MRVGKRAALLVLAALSTIPAAGVASAEPLRVWALSGPSGDYFAGALKRFETATGIPTQFSSYPNEQYKTAIQVGVRSASGARHQTACPRSSGPRRTCALGT